jgi:hypothetical protein
MITYYYSALAMCNFECNDNRQSTLQISENQVSIYRVPSRSVRGGISQYNIGKSAYYASPCLRARRIRFAIAFIIP